MNWLFIFLGFCLLIMLHEAGHYVAAKATGMRVERFFLFFGPTLWSFKRGETEYGVKAIPLGGYVKITGMNPEEEIPPEVAHRAYYRQPVWKRIVVIAAGPAVNIVLAFAILAGVFMSQGTVEPPLVVGTIEAKTPAATTLKQGDVVLAVDGKALTGNYTAQLDQVQKAVGTHKGTPVKMTIKRDGTTQTVSGSTFYDKANKRYRFGFAYDQDASVQSAGPIRASNLAVDEMWTVTSSTVSHIAQIFVPEKRKELGSVVGGYEQTRQAFSISTSTALVILAFISLSLGVINLFPFLPLDGGHIFWAVAEKVRGKAIPFSVMERAGFIGFALVIGLFMIGFTNDLGRITGDGFGLPTK
jgi:regulator of sigma E protease